MAKQVIFFSSRRLTKPASFVGVDEADQDRARLHRVDHVQRRWLDGEHDIGVRHEGFAVIHEGDVA